MRAAAAVAVVAMMLAGYTSKQPYRGPGRSR